MSETVKRFDGRAAEYGRFRERYETEMILPLLRTWCGLTREWVVADVGAGTGMLSDVFLANGNRVLAVEPNEEMREMCAALHEEDARLDVHGGSAEATGLETASIDMVSVGRAMHWFHLDRAMAEFRRVLRPGGWVVVVAFGRTQQTREENVGFEALLRKYSSDGENTHARFEAYERLGKFFDGGTFHRQEMRGEVRMDWEHLLGMTKSLSPAPLEDDVRHGEFVRELRGLYERLAVDGTWTMETRYWIHAGQFTGGDPSLKAG